MWEKRRERKAAEADRRQEFLNGVGGIDLLAHTLLPQLQNGIYGRLGNEVPRKILQDQSRQLAQMFREGWIAGGPDTEGRTPKQFADERLAEFIATAQGSPLMAVARWGERRKKPDGSAG